MSTGSKEGCESSPEAEADSGRTDSETRVTQGIAITSLVKHHNVHQTMTA